jgi:tetratricopeptide (TPR) repeat protein
VVQRESTAYDFLGQAYLAQGQLAEAEAAFRRAIALGKPVSYNQLAYVYLYRRDWRGARDVLAQGIAAVPSRLLYFDFARAGFWSYLAEGDVAGARAAADAYRAEAIAQGVSGPRLAGEMLRAFVGIETGAPATAIAVLEEVRDAVERDPAIDPGLKKRMGHQSRGWLVVARARSGDRDGARRALDELAARVQASPGDMRAEQFLHLARGEVAAGRGDAAAAVRELEGCSGGPFDELGPWCELRRAELLAAHGEGAAADALKAKLIGTLNPDGRYLYLWFKAGGQLAAR